MQMFSSYRSLIFDLRRGRSPFIRTDYSIFYSSSYIGYQMAHSVLGYVVITAITQWSFYGIATLVTSEAARDSAALFMKTTFLTWFVRQVLSWTMYVKLDLGNLFLDRARHSKKSTQSCVSTFLPNDIGLMFFSNKNILVNFWGPPT